MKQNSAQSLVLVIFVVIAFAAITMTLAALGTGELKIREVEEVSLKSRYSSDAGYERALYYLKTKSKEKSTFSYRRKITITSQNSENLVNFPVPIEINTATLINQGKLQPDCDDIKFTDSDGVSYIDYYFDPTPGCDNANTKMWVEIPNIPASPAKKIIYIYYGNPTIGSGHEPDVCPGGIYDGYCTAFFDDAESYGEGITNPDNWSIVESAYYEETAIDATSIRDAYNFGSRVLEVWGRQTDSGEGQDCYVRAGKIINLTSNTYKFQSRINPGYKDYSGKAHLEVWTDSTRRYNDNPCVGASGSCNQWFDISFEFTAAVTQLKLGNHFDGLWSGKFYSAFDDVVVRKYAPNPVNNEVSDDEEEVPSGKLLNRVIIDKEPGNCPDSKCSTTCDCDQTELIWSTSGPGQYQYEYGVVITPYGQNKSDGTKCTCPDEDCCCEVKKGDYCIDSTGRSQ